MSALALLTHLDQVRMVGVVIPDFHLVHVDGASFASRQSCRAETRWSRKSASKRSNSDAKSNIGARLRTGHQFASAILRLPFRHRMRKLAHMSQRAPKLSPFWAERLFDSAFVQASPLAATTDLPNELKPSGHSADEIRRWITAVCRRLSVTPTELAKAANLAPSTVNRFLSGKAVNENVSATTLAKLSKAAEEAFSKFFEKVADFNEFGDNVEVEADWAGRNYDSFDRAVVEVPIISFVWTDGWQTQTELEKKDRYRLSAPIHKVYSRLPIVGLEVRGGTSNKKYPNTTVLICVPYYALDREPIDGEFVIANRKSENGQVEIIVRQYVEERFHPEDKAFRKWLIGLEGESFFQAPIDISYYGYNDSLIVSFLIVGSYRPEKRLFKRPPEFDPRQR